MHWLLHRVDHKSLTPILENILMFLNSFVNVLRLLFYWAPHGASQSWAELSCFITSQIWWWSYEYSPCSEITLINCLALKLTRRVAILTALGDPDPDFNITQTNEVSPNWDKMQNIELNYKTASLHRQITKNNCIRIIHCDSRISYKITHWYGDSY